MKTIVIFLALSTELTSGWIAAQQPTTTSGVTKTNVQWVQGVGPGYWPTAGTGLSVRLAAGTAFCNGAVQNYAGGSLSLSANATNYIYLDPTDTCTPNTNTTGFTPAVIPIAIVTTSTSAVNTITDVRTEFVAPGSATVAAGSCPSNQFVTAVGSATPTCAQPAFSSLSGTAAITQLPLAASASAGILQLTGDLSGSAAGPVVSGIQGIPVSPTPPTANQFLGWNGSQWAPIQPSFSSVGGVVAAGQLPGATASAAGALQLAGDLGGNSSTPRVTWLQGVPLSSTAPAANQVLTYNGSSWTPATPATAAGVGACSANQYVTGTTSGAPTCAQPAFSGLTGIATATQLPTASSSGLGVLQLAGDLGGTAAAPQLASIQGTPVAATAPTANQVLAYNGTSWTPATPAIGAGVGACSANQYVTGTTSGAPTCAQPAFSGLSGTASATQLPTASSSAPGVLQLAGDLGGTAAAPQLASIQGTPVASTTPTANQVLTYNGTSWTPAAPVTGAGVGTCSANQYVTGTTSGAPTCAQPAFSGLTGHATATQLPTASSSAPGVLQLTGDLGGTAAAPQLASIQGTPVAATAPTASQVLTYNGTSWTPASPAVGAGLGACSANQYVTATTSGAPTCAQPAFSGLSGTASATQLPPATSSAQGALQLAGDLSGTAATPKVASIQGTPVASTAPGANQVLTYNGTSWTPATPVTGAGLGSCSANQYVTATTSGAPTCAQPAFSGLSGTPSATQLPAATSSAQGAMQLAGDLSNTAAAPQVISTHLASPLTTAQGGSGAGTFTAHAVLLGEGTSAFTAAGPGTSGQCLLSNGASADPSFAACPSNGGTPGGSATQLEFNNSGAFGGTSNVTYASSTGVVTLNQLANGNDTFYGIRSTDTSPTGNLIHFQNNAKTADLFKVDASGNVTAASFTSTATGPFVLTGTEGSCAGGAAGQDVLCLGNSATHTAQLSLNGGTFVPIPLLAGDLGGTASSPQIVSTHLTSPLTTAQGGSGAGTFTAHALLLGEGTSAFAAAGPGTSGQCLISNGASADPSFAACPSGGGAPGGSTTQIEFNNGGAFGGTSNVTYASSTGVVTLNQLANGNDTFYGIRSTDTSPTGNLIHFQNNAKTADLFKVDASGNVTATSFTSTATGPFVLTGTEGSCAGGAAGQDVLCLGNSSTHTAQLSLNGGSFVPIPQLAGDLGGTASSPQVLSTHLASPLTTAQGGSGAGTFTAHTLLLGEGTSAFAAAGPGTSGQCLISNGASADPSFAACPGGGGGGTPGGANTQFEFNNSGAFGGTSNVTYASSTGVVTLNQLANGNDTFYGVRSTDTSPTGNLIHFQNNAKTADLFKVDASGNVTATSFTSTATGPFVLTGTEGSCAGAAAGQDVLCLGNSSTHTAQLSVNGGSFVPIPQLAGDLGGTASAPQVVSTHLSHLNQNSGSNDVAGTIAISSATSASHTFAAAFAVVPICVITPITMPASGVRWSVSSTATTVTATISASGTLTFNYICVGNPN